MEVNGTGPRIELGRSLRRWMERIGMKGSGSMMEDSLEKGAWW